MRLSPKNKIYCGIVACGVAALVTDRLTRSNDDSAASAATASPSSLLIAPAERSAINQSAPGATALSESAASTTAELLRTAARQSGWVHSPSVESHSPFANDSDASPSLNAKPSESVATFTHAHHLAVVIISEGQNHAMVDGHIYSAGQNIDGFTLQSISQRSVLFQRGHEQAVLAMQGYSPVLKAKSTTGSEISDR